MADAVFNFLHDNKGLPFRTMTVFNWLLEAALLGGLLILLVLLVRALLRGKAGSKAICLAWLLVAARLLIPIALPNPLMNELKPTDSTDTVARPVADQFRVRYIDAMCDLAWDFNANDTLAVQNAPYDLPNLLSDIACYTAYGWLGKWYFFAYLAGVGGVGVFMLCRNLGFRGRLKKSARGELSGEALVAYHHLCDELGRMPLPVTLCDALPGACVVGVFRPRIALSAELDDEAAQAELRRALLLTRYPAWNILRDVCCAVQWFNPLVWVAAFMSRSDQLRAADERMAAGLNAEQRNQQAARLRRLADLKAVPALTVLASPVSLRATAMQKRIAALSQEPTPARKGWRTGLIVAMAVLTLASFFVANTGFSKTGVMSWYDNGDSEYPEYDAESDPYYVYSVANYPDISVENAARYAREDLITNDGFPESEADASRFVSAYDRNDQKYVVRYRIDRATAGESALAYLDTWFPGAESCAVVWRFSSYDTINSKGREGSWSTDIAPDADGVTSAQAGQIARDALVAHWGMAEADAQEIKLSDSDVQKMTGDAFFASQGWPDTYWIVYLGCTKEPGSPCRMVFLDAKTGEAFLFFDFVQNG